MKKYVLPAEFITPAFGLDDYRKGEEERYACYEPIKDALERHFANVPRSERYVSLHAQKLSYK